jgi:isopenicillin N synthase-like dioxygenase
MNSPKVKDPMLYSPNLRSPAQTSEASNRFGSKTVDQFITRGWLKLVTPAVSGQLVRRVYGDWTEFFRGKDKDAYSAVSGQLDGYFPMNSEKAVGANSPDPKEFFHWYRDGQCPPSCSQSSAELFEQLSAVAIQLFSAISDEIPELRRFVKEIATSKRLVLRIAHYLATDEQFLNAPHEDIDFLTILPMATDRGLEVLDGDSWISATASPGECIAFTGELLTEATNGKVKPLRHRVTASVCERLSMSFFVNPDDDVQISPRWTAGELLHHRLNEIYALT